MSKITGVDVFVALSSSKEEVPDAYAPKISVMGEHGEPIKFIQVNGILNLDLIAEKLNSFSKKA
ncbi:MAG: hypothetical protein COB84_06590 [Rhodobacteraceae bacterium]|nr:MAG: hypothetical protein COB84_06590 [Paracoccaceae bacterium]